MIDKWGGFLTVCYGSAQFGFRAGPKLDIIKEHNTTHTSTTTLVAPPFPFLLLLASLSPSFILRPRPL